MDTQFNVHEDEDEDRRSLSPLGVSWESNKSSTSCSICSKPFGRLTQRRHHCRYCGRLVCGTCSAHKVHLSNPKPEFDIKDGDESKDGAQAVRVCDPCFRILTAKEKKIIQKRQQKEKKVELLTSTSYVSNCLVEIYFLDGSHQTVSFDDGTTVADISNQLYPHLSIALFEVIEDIFDTKQYILLLSTQTIIDIVAHWKNTGQKFAKLVLPVSDSTIIKNPLISTSKGFTVADSSNIRKENKAKSSSIPESADSETMLLQREVDRLQYELDKANRKIETWKGVISRSGRSKTLDAAESLASTQELNDSVSVMDLGNDISDNATVITSTPNSGFPPKSKRRSSFGWNVLGDVKSSIKSSIRASFVGGNQMSTYLEGSMNNYEDLNDASDISRLSSSALTLNSANNSQSRKNLGYSKNNQSSNSLNRVDSYDIHDDNSSANKDTPGGKSNKSGVLPFDEYNFLSSDELQQFIGNINFGSNNIEMEILSNPSLFIMKEDNDLSLFIRTYFHHLISLMAFFSKYGNFFQSALLIVKNKVVEESLQTPEDPAVVRSSVISMTTNNFTADISILSKWITSIYSMVSSLDSLYVQILDYYEFLRSELRLWLTTIFPKAITLPIGDPENVKSVMSCMIKENMLLDQSTLDSVQQVISNSIFKGLSPNENEGNNTNRHVELIRQFKQQLTHRTLSFYDVISPLMKNILMTLQYVVGDYLLLFPSDLPVMPYFQTQSYELWDTLIKPYYRELGNNNIEPGASTTSSSSAQSTTVANLSASSNTFLILLEIYLFLEKYILLVDKFGVQKDSLVNKLKDKKIEIVQFLNLSLISDLKLKIKTVSTDNGFHIIGDVEHYQMIMKRAIEENLHDGGGNGDTYGSSSKKSRLMRGRKSGASSFAIDENSIGERGITNYPLFQWTNDLISFLTNIFDTLLNGSDFLVPQNSNTTKGNIQVNFLILLLDSLGNEITAFNSDYLHNLKTADKDFLLKITCFMNSISYFLTLFMEFIDLFSEKFSVDIVENCFEEKFLSIYQSCMELNFAAIEILCRNVFFHEVKLNFQSSLFNQNWIKDMIGIMNMKKIIRSTLLQVNSILMVSSSAFTSPSVGIANSILSSGSGKLGASNGAEDEDDRHLSVGSLGTVGQNQQSQNIPEVVKHKLLVTIIEGIIAMYLELLFTTGYYNFPSVTIEIMQRLSEDLQMITSFFEELRQIILQNQYYSQNVHFISNQKSSVFPSSAGSQHQAQFIPSGIDDSRSNGPNLVKRKKYFFSRQLSTSSNGSIMKATASSSLSNYPRKDVIIQNIQNKQLFDELLFPLQHIVYAVQMPKNHLLEFIQTEIYADFGYFNALRIWQFLLSWRGIKKDEILTDYENYLKDWKPKDYQQLEPKLFIHYLNNHKTNIIKLTKQSNPDL